jgi:hypothetical protein
MYKQISNKDLYDNTYLGFIFEFFAPLEKRVISAKLSNGLGKKVKWFTKIDEGFLPTGEEFKLSPVYSNHYKKVKFETGMLPYQEAINIFLKTTHLIESIGYTSDKCSVKSKINIDCLSLGLKSKMHNLNRFKYLIGLDEKQLFELWPNRAGDESKLFQNQSSFIQPRNVFNKIITESFIESMDPNEFRFLDSELFANDFSEISKGRLIVNYIGGKNYTAHRKSAISTLNLVIERVYETLKENWNYTPDEKSKISQIVKNYRESIVNVKNYFNLKSKYPDIKLYVDLKGNEFLIESNYTLIRERLFTLIAFGGLKEASINYDTHRQALQIKDAKIENTILIEGVEFYDSEIELDAKGCLFQNCNIKNSKIAESTIYSNNLIKNSKIINCDYLGGSNEIFNSFLNNGVNKIINAELTECLVQTGIFSQDSKIDKNTIIINNKNSI